MPISKRVLQRELNLTVIGGGVGDGSSSRHIDCSRGASTGQSKIGMIPQIEELGPKLNLL
jgi:hypothetical protein